MSLFLAYESCKDRFDRPITFDEFKTMFADWECIPVGLLLSLLVGRLEPMPLSDCNNCQIDWPLDRIY